MNSRIWTYSPYIWFSRFCKNGHSDNGYFPEKFLITYIGWIRKNPGIHPSYNFRGFHSKTTIWVQKWNFWNFSKFTLVKAKQISKMSFFQKPLNWVFGKTLKYQIKKLNTWPGQLEHALLTFRTPLAPTKVIISFFELFLKFQKNLNFG